MKHFAKLLFPLLLLLSLGNCQRGDADHDPSPQANLDALWNIIEHQYCFIDYKEKQYGFSWHELHEKYSAQISPQMSRKQLFEVLCELLSYLKDGHVNLYAPHDVGRNWYWYEDYPKNLDEELREDYLGTTYAIASGLKYRVLPDNVAYVVYESFSYGIGEGNLDEMLWALRTCKGMILDVRGNSGGRLDYAERLSARFTNERTLVGYTAHKTGPGRNAFSKPVAEYITPALKRVRWQKPVVVLTNRHCYSSTNTFVRNMKEMPLVTILGDQTGGGSGLPFSSELPIGWAVRFSACPQWDARMNITESGIMPDISVALDSLDVIKGKDTLIEAARSLITSGMKPAL